MLKRVYVGFGVLVLAGYGLASYEGWEFGNPMRDQVPSAFVGGSSHGHSSSWWGRTFWGGPRGGK